jgi:hypothetical protein
MSGLADLAAAFRDYVLHGTPAVAGAIAQPPRASVERRLQVYFDAYRSRLVEALATDYETVRTVSGAGDFGALALAFVEACPSQVRNLRWFGAGLPGFLARTAPWAQRPWLAELAQLEWTLGLAFDAADVAPLAFADLARLPAQAWSDAVLVLHPSVHLLQLRSNAVAVRKAVDAGTPPPAVESGSEPLDWLIWRQDDLAHYRSLPAVEAQALHVARRGGDFAAVCTAVAEHAGDEAAAAIAAGFLRAWVDDQLVVDVHTPAASR